MYWSKKKSNTLPPNPAPSPKRDQFDKNEHKVTKSWFLCVKMFEGSVTTSIRLREQFPWHVFLTGVWSSVERKIQATINGRSRIFQRRVGKHRRGGSNLFSGGSKGGARDKIVCWRPTSGKSWIRHWCYLANILLKTAWELKKLDREAPHPPDMPLTIINFHSSRDWPAQRFVHRSIRCFLLLQIIQQFLGGIWLYVVKG